MVCLPPKHCKQNGTSYNAIIKKFITMKYSLNMLTVFVLTDVNKWYIGLQTRSINWFEIWPHWFYYINDVVHTLVRMETGDTNLHTQINQHSFHVPQACRENVINWKIKNSVSHSGHQFRGKLWQMDFQQPGQTHCTFPGGKVHVGAI